MPRIFLEMVNIENLSLQGALLRCRLAIDNPNAFDLNFNSLEYTIKLGGTTFFRTSFTPEKPIPGKGKTTMNVKINTLFSNIGLGAYQLLKRSKTNYNLIGLFKIDALNGE
ncbi:MAG: LEA type 2 family protein [Desulfobacteraceae bacterium]|nr:LEA type 2 family protein [Desulfobacteraceae bacterium]